MTPYASTRVSTVLRSILLAVGAAFVVTWVAIVCLRIGYPFDLEWMEGGSVMEVQRILQGDKLYVAPTIEFVPYIYNPLYFYVCAAAAKLSGPGYVPLRAVSFASSLGSALVIFALVRRETRSAYMALLSACLFAATYRASGTWFDLARVDALFLFLFLCAVLALRCAASLRGYLLAGLVLYLAFMTKQTGLIVAPPLMLYALIAGGRRGWAFVAAFCVPSALTIVGLDALHDGWYTYYAFKLSGRHLIQPGMTAHFWLRDILAPFAVATGLGGFYLFGAWRHGQKDAVRFFGLFTTGAFTAAFYSRIHEGGAENTLMPAHAALTVLFGLAGHHALERIRRRGEPSRIEWALYAVCLLQFAALVYTPSTLVPTRRDLAAGWSLVTTLSEIEGEVMIDSYPTLAGMAGKKNLAHGTAMKDVVLGDENDPQRKELNDALGQAIDSGRFAAIVLGPDDLIPEDYVRRRYPRVQKLFNEPDVFLPVAGYPTRPELLFRK